jgi:thiamine-phosphate pyrophosphorylase
LDIDFRLYLITDRNVVKKPLPDAVRDALEGGVRAVQLREKDLPVRDQLSLATELRKITKEYGAKLFVNERVDVALAVGADGVHVGQSGMGVAAARKVVGRNMLIGASTHNKVEAIAAQSAGADFITYGPIFDTPSKMKYGSPVGIDSLKKLTCDIKIPIFAIGGIKSGNMRYPFGYGATGIAVISAILGAEDIKAASRKMMKGVKVLERIICESCCPR